MSVMDLRQHRNMEQKVHEQLYDNLFLLSHFYPTSREFKSIFRKDMFVKNNKAAFFEVVYYLLHTLNPELSKQRLTTWPPFEIKRENKFRSEVLSYINELNVLYENADIPHIMSSHLISPGGFKFAKFILKLSQLVVYQHLKKTEEVNILLCPKPSKNVSLTKVNIANLKKKTALTEKETRSIISAFEGYHFMLNERAVGIDVELTNLNQKMCDAKKTKAVVTEEFNKKYPSYPSLSSLEDKIRLLKNHWENLEDVQKLGRHCEQLITYLNSNELILEHSKDDLKLPIEIRHIVKNIDQLDLTEFFQGLNVLLERKALELPNPTSSFINENMTKVQELNEQYGKINNSLTKNIKDLQDMIETLTQELKMIVDLNGELKEGDDTLAVPLVVSEKSN